MDSIKLVLEVIKIIIDYLAIVIMLWGVVLATIKFVKGEISIKSDEKKIVNKENIRAFLATYILLGLEIFIVADIIALIIDPNQEDIIILVIIVVIRTLISFFLERDFRDILGHNRKKTIE